MQQSPGPAEPPAKRANNKDVQSTFLAPLPWDSVVHIASLLDARSLRSFARTCRAAHRACSAPECWRRVRTSDLRAFCASRVAEHVIALELVRWRGHCDWLPELTISTDDVSALATACPQLEELRLDVRSFVCGAIEALLAMPRLHTLVAERAWEGVEAVDKLAERLPCMRGLDLGTDVVTSAVEVCAKLCASDPEHARGLRGLREVGGICAEAVQALFKLAGGLPELEVLRISRRRQNYYLISLDTEEASALEWLWGAIRDGDLPRLRVLDGLPMDISVLQSPAPIESVTDIKGVFSRLPGGAQDVVRARATPLHLRTLEVDDQPPELILALPMLECLSLSNALSVAMAEAVAALPRLTELRLEASVPMGDDVRAALSLSKARIRRLYISDVCVPEWLALPMCAGLRSIVVDPTAQPKRKQACRSNFKIKQDVGCSGALAGAALKAIVETNAAQLERLEMPLGPLKYVEYVPLLLRLPALRSFVASEVKDFRPAFRREDFLSFVAQLRHFEWRVEFPKQNKSRSSSKALAHTMDLFEAQLEEKGFSMISGQHQWMATIRRQ
eukprot:m51a1_g2201 hypothetical protein (562) ;mRNA; f:156091-157776